VTTSAHGLLGYDARPPARFSRRNVESTGSKGGFRTLKRQASGCFPKWRLVTRLLGLGHVARARAVADYLAIEDRRAEAILKAHTRIPAERWQALMTGTHDIVFGAEEAVEFGIAEAIGEFEVPAGQQLFNF
jgi:hypothetical protein